MIFDLNKLFVLLSLSVLIQASPIFNSHWFSFMTKNGDVAGNGISHGQKDNAAHIFETEPIKGDSPLQICDIEEPQLMKITELSLSPNPPSRGSTLNVTAKGIVLEEITEGAFVDVEVRLGYIKILTKTFDLCEQLEENEIEGLRCPIAPGYYEIFKSVEIPKEVPPGKYTVVARAYTENVDELTCITGDVLFPASSSSSSSSSS